MMKPIICTLVVILASVAAKDRYYVSQSKLSFLQALIDCKTRSMEMARIDNETVHKDLTTYLQTLKVDNKSTYWLGGLRRQNGEWVWIETQEVVNFTKWAEKQPGDNDGVNDFCIQMGIDVGPPRPYEWESQTCQTHRFYICQLSDVPLKTTTTPPTPPTTPTIPTIPTPPIS